MDILLTLLFIGTLLLSGYLAFFAGYLLLLSIASFWYRPYENKQKNLPTVAVVIPAHNEERLIATLLNSLREVDYPAALLRIFVIADHCSDKTAEIAADMGATVITRRDEEERGKGAALDYFFREKKTLYSDCDAVAIFDADSVIDPLFFWKATATLAQPGIDVVQGYYTISNPKASWLTRIYHIALLTCNHLRPAGRSLLGSSVTLCGNGMLFTSKLLQEKGWPCNSLAEDLEMSLLLLRSGHHVAYQEHAIVKAEMPTTRTQARSQRERWEWGRAQLWYEQGSKLLHEFREKPSWIWVEAAIDLFVPPLSAILFATMAVLILNQLLFDSSLLHALHTLVGVAFAAYLASAMWQKREPLSTWLTLLALPLYLLFKLTLYCGMLFKRETEWKRTSRETT